MIRKGRFAVSNGREYELISYQRQYYLRSKNPYDLQSGFIKMRNNDKLFLKQVSVKELDDAYEIFPYAILGGYRFSVEGYNKKSEMVTLATNNPFVKEKINVRPHGQYEYIIEVPHEDIQISEDRLAILGFDRDYCE